MATRTNRFGMVTARVVEFRQSNGRVDEIDPRQISAVALVHQRHPILGAILMGLGALALLGVAVVLATDSAFKTGQFLTGVGALALGFFLWAGRSFVRIETTSGQIKTGSTSILHRDDAESYVERVRAAVFR